MSSTICKSESKLTIIFIKYFRSDDIDGYFVMIVHLWQLKSPRENDKGLTLKKIIYQRMILSTEMYF